MDVDDIPSFRRAKPKSSSEPKEAVMSVERDAEEYNMNHNRRGKAVIFNHDMFMKGDPRPGSNHDVKSLTETYTKLGFQVIPYHNKKVEFIKNAITDLVEEDHSDADCLLVTVLTHGTYSNQIQAYDDYYAAENLWLHFRADKCGSLAGKPKIFIIQACRGNKSDSAVTLRHTEADSKSETYNSEAYKIPTYADFLIAYSSMEGCYSFRDPDTGSWFIQSLCKELQGHSSTKDFLKILTRMTRRVGIEYESYNKKDPSLHQKKQVPSFNSMLIRDLYLKPKKLVLKNSRVSTVHDGKNCKVS